MIIIILKNQGKQDDCFVYLHDKIIEQNYFLEWLMEGNCCKIPTWGWTAGSGGPLLSRDCTATHSQQQLCPAALPCLQQFLCLYNHCQIGKITSFSLINFCKRVAQPFIIYKVRDSVRISIGMFWFACLNLYKSDELGDLWIFSFPNFK